MLYCLLHEYNNGADSYLFRCNDPMPKLDDHQLLKLAKILNIEKKDRSVFTMSVLVNADAVTSPPMVIPAVDVHALAGTLDAMRFFIASPESSPFADEENWPLCQTDSERPVVDLWCGADYSVVTQADDRDGILLAAHVRNIPESKLEWL
jgi:hypothetical protein